MKVNREQFLAAAIALSTSALGCGKLASKAEELVTQASPEKAASAQPAATTAPAATEQSAAAAGTAESGGAKTTTRNATGTSVSKTGAKSSLASPTKEALPAPTKEVGVSPTKEVLPAPTKEVGVSPTKEFGLKKTPAPTKEY